MRNPRARLVCAFWWYGSLCPATEFALGERDAQCETLEGWSAFASSVMLMQTRDGAADRSNQAAVVCHP